MKKYDEDYYNGGNAGKMVGIGLAGISFVVFILAVTLYFNTDSGQGAGAAANRAEAAPEEALETDELSQAEGRTKKLRSEDLDFWDMYDYKEEESEKEAEKRKAEALLKEQQEKEQEKLDREEYEKAREDIEKERRSLEEDSDEAGLFNGILTDSNRGGEEENDGLHTLVEKEDGTTQWAEILESVPKNDYDLENGLTYQNPVMQYRTDGKVSSKFGVDVSQEQGDIDWNKVRGAGVDFAMIRVGSRSYQNGELSLDPKFVQNVQGALNAGIKAGVSFYSQAASTEEAVEEANFVVGAIAKFNITYPVACVVEYVPDNAARTDNLSSEQRTQFVMDFSETVKKWGYKPAVQASKSFLTGKLDLTVLSGCDVWLSQNRDKPDYPYEFGMWRYSDAGRVDGIGMDAGLNISFIDYEMR